jgi:hypothetical protein
MSCSISVAPDEQYLFGKAHGPVTWELAQEMRQAYARWVECAGIKRILSDVRGAPNAMDPLENYHYAYADAREHGFPRDARVAILADPGDNSHDFAEIVACNAGFSVKVFHAYGPALEWLCEEAVVEGE